jgi:GNAT superfamily N-acetyltransferase
MGWCTTSDLDRFAAAAGGYLRSRAAENTLLLSAVQAAGSGPAPAVNGRGPAAAGAGLLFGWWEPPDGGDPRGAFVHNPAAPLLISGGMPEMATALAAVLARMGRHVSGVDAPTETADAFAAAWSQRAGTVVRAHKSCRVYRLTGIPRGTPPLGMPGPPGTGAWPPEVPRQAGWLRVATTEDRPLLADWLTAFATEAAERIGSPSDMAADLISYGGAVFWEIPQRPGQFRDAAHYRAIPPEHRDLAQLVAPAHQPVALATLTRPVAGTVRISTVYTLPERRRNGYGVALTQAVSSAVLGGGTRGVLGRAADRDCVREVVMITDMNRPGQLAGRFGYQRISERAVLRFGPATGPIARPHSTNSMPRLPTGPLPRLPRRPG